MLNRLEKIPATRDSVKEIPLEAGVYVFWGEKKPIYIGKAINLRRRLESYFRRDVLEKTAQMVAAAKNLSYIKVTSEMEALLLEADLVWTHQPKYNTALKDDKHPLYIMITKEEYPRVLAVRRAELNVPHQKIFGPFPSSYNLRYVLKLLRPIFPYGNHEPGKKACLYSQMGLCVPCPSDAANEKDESVKAKLRKEYLANIRNMKGVLSGRIKKVRVELETAMLAAAKKEEFESAAEMREKIARLDYITSPVMPVDRFLENPNLLEDIREDEGNELLNLLSEHMPISDVGRIECYDIAHLAGTSTTASMVTFQNGAANKNFYRHFKVQHGKGNNDVLSLTEIAKRRKKHLEDWGRADLMIIDGGKGQVQAFYNEFEGEGIPIVGLAKRFETIVIPKKVDGKLEYIMVRPQGGALHLIQRLRDEAHRFARRYHHKLLNKSLFGDLKKK